MYHRALRNGADAECARIKQGSTGGTGYFQGESKEASGELMEPGVLGLGTSCVLVC